MRNKILFAFVIILFFSLFCSCSVDNNESKEYLLSVNPFPDKTDTFIFTEKIGDTFYLFLPYGTDRTSLYVSFDGQISVNDSILENNRCTSAFSDGEYYSVKKNNKEEITLRVLQSDNLPSVFITTDDGWMEYLHADKNNKLPGSVTIMDGKKEDVSDTLKYIKGRGNSTWVHDSEKKPYNIKLENSNKILGMSAAKNGDCLPMQWMKL